MTIREKAELYDILMIAMKQKIKGLVETASYECPEIPNVLQAFQYGQAKEAELILEDLRRWTAYDD